MTYSVTDYRADFKDYVGDTSLTDSVCDKWLTKSYTRIWRFLWNWKARWELPITLTHQIPVYDTVNLTYYVVIPDTYLAWRFPNNQQISQIHVWSDRNIYVAVGKTNQIIEMLPAIAYPTTTGVFISDIVSEIIVLDAAYHYLQIVARDIETAALMKQNRIERIQELNQKYAQTFIYNENDWYEEVKVNLP